MNYIRTYNQYKKANEGWVSDKMKNWDNDIKDLMLEFIDPMKNLLKEIRDWKTVKDPNKVKIQLLDTIEASFDNLIQAIDKVEKEETLLRLIDDVDQAIVKLNDVFIKDLNSIKESVESTASGIKSVINGLLYPLKELITEFKSDYIDRIKSKETIDDKRQEAKSIIKKAFDKSKTAMKSVDVNDLFKKGESQVKGEEKKEVKYNPGDRVRFEKSEGDGENIAIVSDNQEEVEDDEIRVMSEDGKIKYEIKKDSIIEVL